MQKHRVHNSSSMEELDVKTPQNITQAVSEKRTEGCPLLRDYSDRFMMCSAHWPMQPPQALHFSRSNKMARLLNLEAHKTYATEANAIKAVEAKYPAADYDTLTYFLQRTNDGRYFPVFVGERALQEMVHFHFNVVA